MTRLALLWENKAISFPAKIKHWKSLVLSMLLYGCCSWTLTADLERRILAFENKCCRRMLGISYREHRKTNEYVLPQVDILAGRQELLLSTARRRKPSWFDHVCRHDAPPEIILQGTVDGSRRRGRLRKSWKNSIKEWTLDRPVDVVIIVHREKQRLAVVTQCQSINQSIKAFIAPSGRRWVNSDRRLCCDGCTSASVVSDAQQRQ